MLLSCSTIHLSYIASFVYRKMADTSRNSSFYTTLANHHFILRINSLMKEILQQFKQNYLIKYWNPVAAVIAAGLISAYYFGVTGTYWAVTGNLPVGRSCFASTWSSMYPTGAIINYRHARHDLHPY